jgi:hypothetical protein
MRKRCRASLGEGKQPARPWNTDYTDVLKEAMVGSATMRDTIPAMTQRTNRAIVSFIAE